MTAKTRKAQAKPWTKKLDQDLVQEALEEACIDAYGEDEQHTGLLTLIGNELQFPFEARVMGQTIQVVDMKWPEKSDSRKPQLHSCAYILTRNTTV